jgi:predicted DNA binding CopG/RHH family protein
MTRKAIEKLAAEATSDEEQELWEKKKLGTDPKHTERGTTYKTPSKLISIRVPDEVLCDLKIIADKEGLRYQTYVVSLLKKHVMKMKKAG